MNGWIGVDLDGTLAHYNGWQGVEHIGVPVPAMAARVRGWRAQGIEVRIFTARVHGPGRQDALPHINAWLLHHFGEALPVTCEKDYGMVELWDDRAVQVTPNTGERADETVGSARLVIRAADRIAKAVGLLHVHWHRDGGPADSSGWFRRKVCRCGHVRYEDTFE